MVGIGMYSIRVANIEWWPRLTAPRLQAANKASQRTICPSNYQVDIRIGLIFEPTKHGSRQMFVAVGTLKLPTLPPTTQPHLHWSTGALKH